MADRLPTAAVQERRAELDALLRSCVQCGLCLPVCATWLTTGDETMSPRGRLLLLGDWLAAEPAPALPDASVRHALGTCIGCRACSAVCPSGVPADLLEAAVALAGPGPRAGAAVPPFLVRGLGRVPVLRTLALLAGFGRGLLRATLGPRWRARAARGGGGLARLARLAGSVPRAPRADRALIDRLDRLCGGPVTPPGKLPLPTTPGEHLLWFSGCANEGLLAESSRRLRELLAWAGADLVLPAGTTCCGALAAHGNRHGQADAQRDHNLAAWRRERCSPVAIITEAAGCGAAIRAYGARLPAPQVDALVWLARARRPTFGRVPLKVALHDPCHARHGQGIVDEPRALLRAIPGLVLLEPDEADACCGSGGAWGLHHPGLSAEIGARKARLLAATGADLVVTGNPGCLGQIADGLAALSEPAPPVIPLGDLLWYAARRGALAGM